MATIRLQAKIKEDLIQVRSLIRHPMESGFRRDLVTGKRVPAHFIKELTCEHNGKVIMSAILSGGISKNPYFSFKFKGGTVGESLKLTWVDNQGQSDSRTVKIKKSRR